MALWVMAGRFFRDFVPDESTAPAGSVHGMVRAWLRKGVGRAFRDVGALATGIRAVGGPGGRGH